MRRQRNISQMKEQNKTPEKNLNQMKTSNLPDAELKTLVIGMLSDLNENFNKDTVNISTAIKNEEYNKEIKNK